MIRPRYKTLTKKPKPLRHFRASRIIYQNIVPSHYEKHPRSPAFTIRIQYSHWSFSPPSHMYEKYQCASIEENNAQNQENPASKRVIRIIQRPKAETHCTQDDRRHQGADTEDSMEFSVLLGGGPFCMAKKSACVYVDEKELDVVDEDCAIEAGSSDEECFRDCGIFWRHKFIGLQSLYQGKYKGVSSNST